VGFDRDRKAARTFRVDRLVGSPSIGKPGSVELPKGFDAEAALPDEPWKVGEDETRPVRVLVDSLEAPRVVQQLGENSISETRPDDSVVVELQVSNEAALISWVLALGPHAEVLSPPQVRAAVVEWLRSFDDAPTEDHVR
jgi:predicted DNA-binding transcriptional regulator YafY